MAGNWDMTASPNANGSFDIGRWIGGEGDFAVHGTFGSGLAKLQWSPDEKKTWIDYGSETWFTANNHARFKLPPSVLLRVNVADATGAVDLTARIHHMRGPAQIG